MFSRTLFVLGFCVVVSCAAFGVCRERLDPIVARACSLEKVRSTVGGGDCAKATDTQACDQDETTCGENGCVGDPTSPYGECVDTCLNGYRGLIESACDYAAAHPNEMPYYGDYSACDTALTAFYKDACEQGQCVNEDVNEYTDCDLSTPEEVARLVNNTYYTYTLVDAVNPQATKGAGYCTRRWTCNSRCYSDDGGMTFSCQRTQASQDADYRAQITNSNTGTPLNCTTPE